MERQTRLFTVAVVLLACSAAAFAEVKYTTANFKETRTGMNSSSISGVLYYKYDTTTRTSSRLRFEYTLTSSTSTTTVSNLYHYKDAAMYSMCTGSCTGILITEGADPWFYDSNFYDSPVVSGSKKTLKRKSTYLVTDKVGVQVTSIILENDEIKEVYFKDGRHIILSNVNHNSVSDNKFEVDYSVFNCPKATCPIYADLIFVLDNSGSVSDSEWKQTAEFVNKVMDSFTFGSDAAEAALIQFNGGSYSQGCSTRKVYYTSTNYCNKCYTDYTFYTSYAFPGYATATIFGGRDQGNGMSVSENRDGLKSTMSGNRPSRYGNTCQGYGLELAMTVIERSPRSRYGKRPQPIVIAVTDGVDMCVNRTTDAANKLRSKYDAFVIEVGVGMSTGCGNYDRKFLERIASKIGSEDNPAYYPVTSYSAIRELSDKLFKPLCDGFNAACGPDCLGFCGCGKCWCPDCDATGTSCRKNTCTADSSSSTGCVVAVNPCPKKDDVCTTYTCNGAKPESDPNRCTAKANTCSQLVDQNKNYACREVKCDVLAGGCHISKYDDNYCQTTYGNKCLQYECARSNSGDTIGTSGCRLSLNRTLQKETELKNSGKNACVMAVCTPSVGVSEKDLCPGKLNSTVCYDSSCTLINKKYQCKDVAIHRPAETNCTKYECKSTGWVKKAKYSEADCRKEFLDSRKYDDEKALRCINAFCSDENGHRCYDKPISGCSTKCDPENNTKCKNEGYQASNLEKCYAGSCDYIKVSDEWQQMCIPLDSAGNLPSNCLNNDTLMQAAKNRNEKNKDECCTVACTIDGCDIVCEGRPASLNNKCLEHECVFVHAAGYAANRGTWKWDIVASKENSTCKTDECYKRRCDPTDGCVEVEEICLSRNTECFTYNCIIETGKCNETNHLIRNTTCTLDVCVNGTINFTQNLDGCDRLQTDKCVSAECVYVSEGVGKRGSSWCNYTKIPDPTDNPCIDYTCYTEDGKAKWKNEPHCYDGLYCTEDVCTVFGECKFKQVKCSDELDMEGYPCFEARCTEKPENSTYKCVRKLIKNAYIDVCGNCIIEKIESQENSDSSASSSEEEIDLLECTGAPPKPLLTEGLAAATVALIVIGAVVIGSGIAASGVIGTKTLIARAKGANNQSAHTNPLFQDNEAEMSNPAFIEEKEEI